MTDDDSTDPTKRRYSGWPRLYVGDVWGDESGDPNVDTTITFTMTLYPTSRSTVTVKYRTVDGSAKAGVNYRSTSGTVTFAPREKHKTVTVDVMDDGQGPGTEFQLVLNGPHGGGAEVRDYWVTGRIYDDTPTFRSWDESARESGNGGETQMNFYVSLHHGDDDETYTIDYATVDGSARAGSDYTATSGTLTFVPGEKHYQQVTVPILDDAVQDSGEQFSLVLSNPTGGAQPNRWHHTVTGTILNEDAPGVAASFPGSSHRSASHSGATDSPTVVVAFSEAVAAFAKTTPSVNVGNATITSVAAHTESGLEHAYIFTLDPDGKEDISFSLKSNEDCDAGGICTSAGIKLMETPDVLTIPGPKPPRVTSQLSVSDASASEEDDSTIDFVVNLAPASDETVTVSFSTADRTATAGGDYTAQSGSLTFSPGETSKTIQVAIIDDDFDDNYETLSLTLSGASGAQISDSRGTGVISNQEPDPLTARFINMPKTHDGSTAFTYAVEFSHDVLLSAEQMRDYGFSVTNGQVTAAGTISGLKYLWEFTVEPDTSGAVTITLLGQRDCSTAGAICKEEAPRQLSHNLTATLSGPVSTEESSSEDSSSEDRSSDEGSTDKSSSQDNSAPLKTVVQVLPNSEPTGAPTISGTPQVEQTLTANTSSINDADGLTGVSYRYQWIAGATDIVGATSSSYTLTASEQGQTIQVRVTFSDDADNEEILTSVATEAVAARPNSAPTGAPTISETSQVGETLTADTSAIVDEDGLENVSYRYQWLAGGSDIAGATGSSYTLTSSELGQSIQVRVTFSDDRGNEETLTSVATDTVAVARVPLTVALKVAAPASHDGSSEFTFEIEFSEEFGLSYRTLRDFAFTETGSEVRRAQRMDKPSNIRWLITVEPDGDGDVSIVLPVTTGCDAIGAICTGDKRKLSNSLTITVTGPGQ